MPPAGITVRRATLDDLEALRGLWRECRLPEHELERRFTEFQLAVDAHDWILGCLGLRFAGHHGQVHSLAIRRPEMESELSAALWERVLALAQQQAALRLWTHQHSIFWTDRGFVPAVPADLNTLPPALGSPAEAWHTLKLRDEPLKMIAAEEQLEAFLELEHLRTDRLVRRSRVLKILVTVIAAILFAVSLVVLFTVLRRERRTPRRPKV